MNRMSVSEKLAIDKFELDEGYPHIEVDNEICKRVCKTKECLFVCPADLYSEHEGEIVVDWGGCLECGTCQNICQAGALHWVYPRGGFGILYRYG